MLRLLDSVLRGYPVGIVLLWETYNDIQYRTFVRDFKPGNLASYRDNTEGQKLKLVLDGQQRLQSLYIALHGTMEGKALYFDILSGRGSDNLDEEKYKFAFSSPNEVANWHAAVAVSDLGAKFDLDPMRKKGNLEKLQQNFEKCCNAISSAVDFVLHECHCASSALIGGSATMVPFAYYLFHAKSHLMRNDQISNAKKSFYVFALARPFSRCGDLFQVEFGRGPEGPG